jgi:hypothetical protein
MTDSGKGGGGGERGLSERKKKKGVSIMLLDSTHCIVYTHWEKIAMIVKD